MSKSKGTPDPTKATVLEVWWDDSNMNNDGWETPSYHLQRRRKAVRCYSVGIALADDRAGVILAISTHLGRVSGVMTIPRSQIRKVRRLR